MYHRHKVLDLINLSMFSFRLTFNGAATKTVLLSLFDIHYATINSSYVVIIEILHMQNTEHIEYGINTCEGSLLKFSWE
jgi:hypothetical protein